MRKRYKIPLAAILAFFGIITAGVLIFTQTPLLRLEVNRSLKKYLKDKYHLDVKIGGLSGNGFSELLLTDVTVNYEDSLRPYRLLKIDTLFARYKASDFFRRRWLVDSLSVHGAEGVILSDASGKLLLPSLAGEEGSQKKLPFEISHFEIKRLGFKLFLPSRSWEVSDYNARGRLMSDGDRFTFALSQVGFKLPLESLQVERARLGGEEFENRIRLDSFFVASDSSEVSGKGALQLLPKPEFELKFQSRAFSFSELRRLTGLSLSGDLALAANLKGDFSSVFGSLGTSGVFLERSVEDLKVEMSFRNKAFDFSSISGQVAGAAWKGTGKLDLKASPPRWEYAGAVENFDLNKMVPQTLPSSLSGEVNAQGQGLSGKDLQVDLTLNLGAGSFDEFPFSSAAGKVSVNVNEAVFAAGFSVNYLNSAYQFSGRIDYNDSASVSGTAQFADLKDFWGKLFVKKLAGRGAADFAFSGKTKDFDVRGTFRSDSLFIYDIFSKNFSAQFNLARFLTRRKGETAVHFGQGRAYAVPLDSAGIKFELDSNLVNWDSGWASGPNWQLNASGRLKLVDSLHQEVVLPEGKLVWNQTPIALKSPALLALDSSGVTIKNALLQLADGTGSVTGFLGYNETLNLDFSTTKVSLPAYYTFLQRNEETLKGWVSLSGHLSGPFENPEMNFSVRIDSLKRRKLLFGDLTGKLHYANRQLGFQDFIFESPYGSSRLSGQFPVDLSLARREERVLEEQMNFSVSASGQRFDLLNLVLSDVENLSGDFKLNLSITGTPNRPQFGGEVELKKGRLKLLELENPIENLDADLALVNNRLVCRSMTGTTRWKGKTGKVLVGGAVEFTSLSEFGYDLRLKGEKFPFSYEFDELEGVADFDLTVTGQTPPEVAGKINLLALTYSGDFAEETRTTFPFTSSELSSKWDFNLLLSSLNNWWVKTSDVNAELKGDIYVLRREGVYNFLGKLETIRGRYSLLGNSFQIERGLVTYDDIAEANPKLDISAVSKLRPPRTANQVVRPSDIELRILIGGTLRQPEVKPDPSSPYTEQDVVFLLATSGRSSNPDSLLAGGGGFSQRLTIGGLSLAAQAFQRAAGRGLGVETIELSSEGNGNLLESRLTIGKYAIPGLYIYGSSPLSTFRGQELGFEYSLGRRFYLEGLKDRSNQYRFNLNLRWEY